MSAKPWTPKGVPCSDCGFRWPWDTEFEYTQATVRTDHDCADVLNEQLTRLKADIHQQSNTLAAALLTLDSLAIWADPTIPGEVDLTDLMVIVGDARAILAQWRQRSGIVRIKPE